MKRILLIGGCIAVCLLAACSWANRPSLKFSPRELPEAAAGHPYQVTITVSENKTPVFAITASNGELPPGLTLQYEDPGESAEISGIPEQAGVYRFKVTAHCLGTNVSGQVGEQTYTLVVK